MSENSHTPVVISLPNEDGRTSFTFYRDGLDFDPSGEPEAGHHEREVVLAVNAVGLFRAAVR